MQRQPSRFTEHQFDLLIIGGGINGAGCCRDAALRGLRVGLIEKHDLMSGTSSVSSKLVHGGLRYLEMGDLRLVREALHERSILKRIAPHIVHPLEFHIPIYRKQKRSKVALRLGLWLYDLLAGKENFGSHGFLSREEMLRQHPHLRSAGLTGGARYYDGWMDDARLGLANIIDADRHGAAVCNYMEAIAVESKPDGNYAVTARDNLSGSQLVIHARCVLNTTGPWSDRFRRVVLHEATPHLLPSKGVHLVFTVPSSSTAMLLFAADGRVFFLIPWYGATLLGTTDTPFDGDPEQAVPTPEDEAYLIRSISHYIGTEADWRGTHITSFAGIRPLVAQHRKPSYRTSREHLLVEERPNLFTLVGGKFTTYRAMAESTIDTVCKSLGLTHQPCLTHRRSLPGGEMDDFASWYSTYESKLAESIPDDEMRRYLAVTFGTEVDGFIERYRDGDRPFARIDPRMPVPRAMRWHAGQYEMAMTDEDFSRRRTPLQLLGLHEIPPNV